MRTIFEQIVLHAAFTPRQPAIALPDRVVTYDMLQKGVLSIQSVLREAAIDRDRPVGIVVDNPARHLIVLLALLKSGYTFSSLRPNQIETAYRYGVAQLIAEGALHAPPGLKTLRLDDQWFLRSGLREGMFDVTHEAHRIVQVAFSSGSTGFPKALGQTLDLFQEKFLEIYQTGIAARPRFLTTVGFSGSALKYVLRILMDGATVYMCPQQLALSAVFSGSIDEVRASAIQARNLLQQQKEAGYDVRIDVISTGSAILPVDLAGELQETFRCDIINTYASTEAGMMALAAGEIIRKRRQKGNCFIPFKKIEIVDDADRPMPVGAEGRIRVKAPNMARLYTGDMFAQPLAEEASWFYPGDIGKIDEDGLLIVTGRKDEIINAGGIKYSPEMMEDELKRHPAIANAAVVRMTGKDGGDEFMGGCGGQHAADVD